MKNIEDKEFIHNILITPQKSELKWGEIEFNRREETDKSNIFNPTLIKLCNNLEKVHMFINEYHERQNIYTLSLIALLSIIEGTQIKQVTIYVYWKGDEGEPWIWVLWNSCREELKAKYAEKGYDIDYFFYDEYDQEYIKITKL